MATVSRRDFEKAVTLTKAVGVRVNLEHIPSLSRDLYRLPLVLESLPPVVFRGRTFTTARLEHSILPGSKLKVLQGMVLGKHAKLNLIAGDIEERRVREKQLTKDWVEVVSYTRTRDVHERERHG